MKCDVLVWRELRGVFSHAKKKYGHIDVVFANAGIAGPLDQFEDKLDEDGELEEPNLVTIDVNLKSVVASQCPPHCSSYPFRLIFAMFVLVLVNYSSIRPTN